MNELPANYGVQRTHNSKGQFRLVSIVHGCLYILVRTGIRPFHRSAEMAWPATRARRWPWVVVRVLGLCASAGALQLQLAPRGSPAPAPAPAPALDAPYPKGGGACATAAQCQLNGRCAGGTCACDAAWTGSNCSALDLLPAPVEGALYGPPTAPTTCGRRRWPTRAAWARGSRTR